MTITLPTHAVPDCTLDDQLIELSCWSTLTSADLARIVGLQQPSEALEDASEYEWTFQLLPTSSLVESREDGEPEEGWPALYQQYLENDAEAAAQGSPEYAGRDAWIQSQWSKATDLYPLFVVTNDASSYRLWDGHRRLAGAFFHQIPDVWALVGTPKAS